MRKLLSRAFQRCITLYSQKWTVWPWEAIFYQKMLHKQLFREALNADSLTSEQSGTPNFKNLTSFNMFPENLGAKAFRWAIGKPAGIKIVRSAAAWNISWGSPQEMQKWAFFASFASPRGLCEEKYYQGRTMWKSTDSAFRRCVTDTWGSGRFLAKLFPLKIRTWRQKWNPPSPPPININVFKVDLLSTQMAPSLISSTQAPHPLLWLCSDDHFPTAVHWRTDIGECYQMTPLYSGKFLHILSWSKMKFSINVSLKQLNNPPGAQYAVWLRSSSAEGPWTT